MWNFKRYLWNSTQNILPIHWKIQFLCNIEILRALRFKSSYAFLLVLYHTLRRVCCDNRHFLFRIFEMVSRYCEAYNSLIPVAFVLGFYVSIVVARWWEQFNNIPWPDRMALFITANMHGHDDRGRLMRRTVMRYLCLSFVITLSSISPAVKKRFPTFSHMMEAGENWAELSVRSLKVLNLWD